MEWERGGACGRGRGGGGNPARAGEGALGGGGAGPQRPLPAAAPRPGLLFGSLSAGPAQRQWLGESAPASSPARAESHPPARGRRRSWSGCRIPAQPLPPILPHSWTSGPWAPHPQGSGSPLRPARRLVPRRPLSRAPSPPPGQTSVHPWTPPPHPIPPPLPQPGPG